MGKHILRWLFVTSVACVIVVGGLLASDGNIKDDGPPPGLSRQFLPPEELTITDPMHIAMVGYPVTGVAVAGRTFSRLLEIRDNHVPRDVILRVERADDARSGLYREIDVTAQGVTLGRAFELSGSGGTEFTLHVSVKPGAIPREEGCLEQLDLVMREVPSTTGRSPAYLWPEITRRTILVDLCVQASFEDVYWDAEYVKWGSNQVGSVREARWGLRNDSPVAQQAHAYMYAVDPEGEYWGTKTAVPGQETTIYVSIDGGEERSYEEREVFTVPAWTEFEVRGVTTFTKSMDWEDFRFYVTPITP